MTLTDKIVLALQVIGGTTALVLFIIGFVRYQKDQNWKRKEFVSKEIKEFLNNQVIKNCLLMLDWDTRYIELYPNNPDYKKRFSIIGRKEVTSALIPHGNLKRKFTRDESVIRDHFDFFLDNLSRFEQFIKSDLLKSEDLEPYLKYWIDTISEELPEPLKSTVHHYIAFYEYSDVISLFERFSKELKPTLTLEKIISELEETTNNNI